MAKKRIDQRIDEALNGEPLNYHSLAVRVFPEKDYPRAFRYQSNGGPPGCYMALSAALRRYGFNRQYTDYRGNWVNLVYPRKKSNVREGDENG